MLAEARELEQQLVRALALREVWLSGTAPINGTLTIA
jgi:hypothetical protein